MFKVLLLTICLGYVVSISSYVDHSNDLKRLKQTSLDETSPIKGRKSEFHSVANAQVTIHKLTNGFKIRAKNLTKKNKKRVNKKRRNKKKMRKRMRRMRRMRKRMRSRMRKRRISKRKGSKRRSFKRKRTKKSGNKKKGTKKSGNKKKKNNKWKQK